MTEKLIEIMASRPNNWAQEKSFVSQDEKDVFTKNNKDLAYLISTRKNPLKVVLMGEVKAGKSTLVNAIVGEDVSPVGVTETTAIVLEISHGIEKEGTIHRKDGTTETMSIPSLYQLLEENRNNSTFYTEIDSVRLTFPLPSLQDIHLVDTPGIETITAANHETTQNFIQKADVVIWVLSALHLGQANIEDQIMDVAGHGKPIVLLINRIDQITGSVESVVDYTEDEYGIYTDAIFPISGYLALEGKKNSDEYLYARSGLEVVMEYLEKNIDITAEEVKEDSFQKSISQIFRKEAHLSKMILKNIEFSEDSLHHRIKDIQYYSNKIINAIQREAKVWLESEFMQHEEAAVMNLIQSNSKSLLSNNISEIKKMLIEYSNENYVSDHLGRFWTELSNFAQVESERALAAMYEKFQHEEMKYMEEYNLAPVFVNSSNSLNFTDDSTDLAEGAKKGAFLGGAYGMAAAAYAAVIGPSAAYITLGAALGSVLPPVLLVGAVTGAAYKFVNKDKKIKEIQELAQTQFSEIRKQSEFNLRRSVDELCQRQARYFENIEKKMTDTLLKGITLSELQELKLEWEKYILLVEEAEA